MTQNLPAIATPAPVDPNPALAAAAARTGQLAHTVDLIEITDEHTEAQANELLSMVAKARRDTEAARKDLVGPLNATVKKINEGFRDTLAPLEHAEAGLKAKIGARLAWHRQRAEEAERRRQLEAARVEAEQAAERRREEEAARAAREAAAREAARLEAEQRRAERERLARLDAKKSEMAARCAQMTDDELRAATSGLASADDSDAAILGGLANEELDARQRAREAAEKAAAARQAEQDAREAERAAREAAPLPSPAIMPPPTSAPIRTASGTTSTRKDWRIEITNPKDVPREFMRVDEQAILAHVRRTGGGHIAGVRSWQDETVVNRSR